MKTLCLKLFPMLALAVAALVLGGCATPEKSPNVSERPWNSPQGWENGVPSSLYEYR